MGLLSAVLDHDRVLYIMTLGVLEGHRHRGLASTLISIACQHAYESRWVQDTGLGSSALLPAPVGKSTVRLRTQMSFNSTAWS
jgi:hypothetical protein